MTERRRYSAKDKAEAVGLAVVRGASEASRETGIPRRTLGYWVESEEFATLRQRKKEEVAAEVWATFQMGVRRISELIPVTDDMTKVATATGIIYDKFALMSGQATDRTETRELVQGFDDGEKEALQQWLHDLAKERAHAG